jgi:predicted transcriptional regulator
MSKKRERTEIINDILRVIREKRSIKPTHILYKSNHSHKMLSEYLSELIMKELVAEKMDKEGKKTYELTDKGHKYLNEFGAIKAFMDSYGLSDS